MLRKTTIFSLLALLSACGGSEPQPAKPTPDTTTVTSAAPAASSAPDALSGDAGAASMPGGALSPAASATDVANVVFPKAIAGFNADLYAKLKTAKGNVFYSPASIELALAMTAGGAKGTTLSQMQTVLHLNADAATTNQSAAALLASWKASGDGPTLLVANRLWGQTGYAFVPDYLQTTRDTYGAELSPLDYKKTPDEARKTINGWISDQTNQKIQDLLGPGSINNLTRLVLTNAVYFKGTWKTQFDKASTKPAPFRTSSAQVTVPTMHHNFEFVPYADLGNAEMVELPYKGDDKHRLSMVIVLPKTGTPIANVESQIDAASLTKWTQSPSSIGVNVSLPKFKTSGKFELGPVLKQMGMPLAFTDKADFTGIAQPNPKEPLFISNVVHKAFVDVDEAGTEAAAATGVVMATRASAMGKVVDFKVDHPFLFFIRDDASDTILFAGRIEDPTK